MGIPDVGSMVKVAGKQLPVDGQEYDKWELGEKGW
jgi:hypothetical protein